MRIYMPVFRTEAGRSERGGEAEETRMLVRSNRSVLGRALGRLSRPVLTALLITACGAAPAHAQPMMLEMDAPRASVPLNSGDLRRVTELLGLNEAQATAVGSLLDACSAESRRIAKDTRDQVQALHAQVLDPSELPELRPQMTELMTRASAERTKLRTQLLDDLKALLTTEQADRWPGFERFVNRRELLPKGVLAGESTDLTACVDSLALTPPLAPELTQMLAEYELALDSALRAREDARKQAMAPAEQAGEGERFDRLRAYMKSRRELGVPVRDINLRYARLLESVVPEDHRSAFAEVVRARLYPRIYGQTHAQRALEAAGKLDDLSPEQRERVLAIAESFARDAAPINQRWATALAQTQAAGGGLSEFELLIDGAQPPEPDPNAQAAKEAQKLRREIERSALKALREALTPEQVARLPRPRPQHGMFLGGEAADEAPPMWLMPTEGDHVEIESVEIDGQEGGGVMIRRTLTAP